jgi:hypothetical protein
MIIKDTIVISCSIVLGRQNFPTIRDLSQDVRRKLCFLKEHDISGECTIVVEEEKFVVSVRNFLLIH